MTKLRLRPLVTSDIKANHEPTTAEAMNATDPAISERYEALRAYTEELQNTQLRLYLRGDPGLDNRDDM